MTCRCDPFTGDECSACRDSVLVNKVEYERLQEREQLLWAVAGYCRRELEDDTNDPCCARHLQYVLSMVAEDEQEAMQ